MYPRLVHTYKGMHPRNGMHPRTPCTVANVKKLNVFLAVLFAYFAVVQPHFTVVQPDFSIVQPDVAGECTIGPVAVRRRPFIRRVFLCAVVFADVAIVQSDVAIV